MNLRKFYSYLLLGVFQVFVLHQGFAHVHHEHNKSDHVDIEQHAHVHSHHHTNSHQHHQDAPDNKQNSTNDPYQGLLGFILGDHSHSEGFNHHQVVTNPVVKGDNAKNLARALVTSSSISEYSSDNVGFRMVLDPTQKHINSYTPYFNHRGPPAFI